MKKLLILSGKGGTGKTTISAAFIRLAGARAFADCDVETPNLHLLMAAGKKERQVNDYYGLPKAFIDVDKCTECDLCRIHCRFRAIEYTDHYFVKPLSCEGCGVCEFVCPSGAIEMLEHRSGELSLYKDESGDNSYVFSTGRIFTGSGTSGLLVTEVKDALYSNSDADLAIIDGSPGIGCPVIASISGVNLVLVVTEPTLSGMEDMKRIIKTARNFNVPVLVCINKFDLSLDLTEDIESFLEKESIEYLGRIPFDEEVAELLRLNLTVVDRDTVAGGAVKEIFEKTMAKMRELD